MGTIILPGKPHPKQVEFFIAEGKNIAYGGARGGGKSWAMRRKMVLRRLKYPGSKGLLLRRTYPELYQNHVLPLLTELYGLAQYNQQNHVFTFPNDSRLFLGYCDAETDVLRYQGQEYDDIGLEEATQFTEYQYQFLKTCSRTTRTDLKPRMYYTANPGGIGHGWFRRLFIDKDFLPGENSDDYIFIQAKVYDNPTLIKSNPEYVQQLESLPEDMRRAFLDGDWDIFAGQYFREFRRDVHVIEPFELPAWWRRFRSLDYGLDCTACYWWAVDGQGKCYIYRELYEPNLTLSDAAKKILGMTPGNEKITYTVASPDLWNRRQDTGIAGYEVMAKAGLHGMIRADDRRVPGWRALREYLKLYQDEQDVTTARVQIFSTCANLIRTLPTLVHDPHDPEDVDDHCEDHACLVTGTLVTTDTGLVPIESIMPGNFVLTRQGYRQVQMSGITSRYAKVLTVVFSDGRRLTGTANHPVWVKGKGFIPLGTLRYGDMIEGEPILGNTVHVVFSFPAGTAPVYNLAIDGVPEFYANGVLVHNCESIRYGIMSRPVAGVDDNELKLRTRMRRIQTQPSVSDITGY